MAYEWLSSLGDWASENSSDLIGGGLAAVGGYLGSQTQSDAYNDASAASLQANNNALQLQSEMYNTNRADYEPYRMVGYNALPQLQSMTDGTYDGTQSPYYKYMNDEMTRSINREMNARGGYNSSGAVNALSRMRQGLLADDYNQQYNRVLNNVNIGRGSTTSTANAGQSSANAMSSLLSNSGATQAQGILGSGAAQSSMYSNLGALPYNMQTINALR